MLNNDRIIRYALLFVISISFSIASCATKKHLSGDPQTGLILEYRIRKDQELHYERSTESTESMEAMGRSIETSSTTGLDYTIRGVGTDEQNNIITRVVINDMMLKMDSLQGTIVADTSKLKGESFGVTFSPKADYAESTGIEKLPLIGTGGVNAPEQSAGNFVSELLPKLPDDKIKIGDTWSEPIHTTKQQGQAQLTMDGEAVNIFDGVETVRGMECIRIKTQTNNKLRGTENIMGQEIKINGDGKGTTVWYFAYNEGILVEMTLIEDIKMKLNLGEIGEIPQSIKRKTMFKLVQ